MAKRSNPFINDYIPQSKVHFGLKQFNNNEDGLRKVYEKTLQLLYKGAKKTDVAETPKSLVTINKDDWKEFSKDKMKQLFIGQDGALLRTGTMVKTSNCMVKRCDCGGSGMQECAYCEKAVCDLCRHLCRRCDHLYCSHCSLIGSEGSEVCVSCYG